MTYAQVSIPFDDPDTPLDTPYPCTVTVSIRKASATVRAGPATYLARHAWSLFDITHVVPCEPWETLEQRVRDEVEVVKKAYVEEAAKRGFRAHCTSALLPVFDGQTVTEEAPA